MRYSELEPIPESYRDPVAAALRQLPGEAARTSIGPIRGGASGALTYRVRRGGRSYFLRLETLPEELRNPNQYRCMQVAADAGVAPPIAYLDQTHGVSVTPFIESHQLSQFPGGPEALADALGGLLGRLQTTEPFPVHGDYVENLGHLLQHCRQRRFAAGLLDRHAAAFERIRDALPRDPSTFVSSHNDPNMSNVLFDGRRLWLIDWETAARNDPLVDVAIVSHEAAPTVALQDVLLRAWLDRPPDPELRARLVLTRALTQLHVACILQILLPPAEPITDLSAPSGPDLIELVRTGRLTLGTAEFNHLFSLTTLGEFLDATSSREVAAAIATMPSVPTRGDRDHSL